MAATPNPQSTAPAIGAFRTRAVARGIYEEDLKRFMVNFIERSVRKKNDFEDIWDEVLENYLVTFPRQGIRDNFNRVWHGRSQIGRRQSRLKDPETHQIIEALAAQGLGLVFGVRDYLKALPLNGQMDKARQLGKIQMGVLEDQGNFRTMYELLKDSFIFGTSIFEVGWEQRQRRQLVLEPTFDENLGIVTGRRAVPRDVVYKDRPLIRPVDIYDFYPDATGTRIQENMIGVAKRFRITAREVEGLWKAGTYNNGPAVQRLLARSFESKGANSDARGISEQHGGDTRFEEFETVEEHGIMVGFEYWGTVPFATPDGARNRVITTIGGEIVRDSMNPYINGRLPFKEIVMNPVSGRFYGLSPAEVVRFLQDSTDNFFMVMNDAADLAIRTPLLVGQAFTGDLNKLQRREPNALIECRNPEAVKPLDIDLSALNYAAGELARRKQTMREAGGAANPLQAIPSGDRTTATEINTLTQVASQRVDMMMQLVEREDLPMLATLIHERLKQFIPADGMIATVENETIPFTYDDIDLEAEFTFVGTRHSMSKQQKVQNLTLAMQTLAQEPKLMFLVPELVVRLLRDGLEIDDAEAIMNEASKRFQQLQAQEEEAEANSGEAV